MISQLPVKRFEASGALIVDPPVPLADANGNRDICFQQRVVQYQVDYGTAQSTFEVVEKKWTGLPLLCACRRSLEVTVAIPRCMWGSVDRRRVRDAFRSSLVTSATQEATKSSLRGQPFIRDIVGRTWLCVSARTDAKRLQIEEQRKKVLDEIESSDFDTEFWRDLLRDAGRTKASLVFEVKEPVPFKWTYKITADDVELDAEELQQKIIDHLDVH
jgi:hypothetical protein